MKLKFMQYNIFGGFHSEEPYVHQPDREKAASEVIRNENPDVLTICEARFARPNKFEVLQDYKKIFSYPYFYIASYKERSGMAIFSKFPFEVEDYAYGLNPLLRTNSKIKGKVFMLDLVHPHPTLGEEAKEKFVKHVLSGMKKPYIIMGDFNAISPEDKYDREGLVKGFSRFEKEPVRVVDDFLKRTSIKTILNKGLKDSFKEIGKKWQCTVPTDLFSKEKNSGLRIDFIFYSKEFKVKNAGIIINNLTNKASDHYPIYAVLEI